MALSNIQYEAIKRVYEQRRLDHTFEQKKRKEEIYEKVPGFRELDAKVISVSMEHARALILSKKNSSGENSLKHLRMELLDLKLQKKKLLTNAGYPYDYLDLEYTCSKCLDTGYIDSEKCSCFKQMEVEYLYDASHLKEFLAANNFSTLSKHYYSEESLEDFEHALKTSRNFINNFNSDYRNLLFHGTVGTGKSFLSGCIAKELLDRGCVVLYFSSISLFQSISAFYYEKGKEVLNNLYNSIYNSDLLIVDDLGTELTNDFTRSQLFNILNERNLRHKSTIISTNLSLEEIRSRYSDRVFSRICESFELCRLSGRDIRLQKKLELNAADSIDNKLY